jgi:hypothetical protein
MKKLTCLTWDFSLLAAVDGGDAVTGNLVRSHISAYDRSEPPVIGPVISYDSYLGGAATMSSGQLRAPISLWSARRRVLGWTVQAIRKSPYQTTPPAKLSGQPAGSFASAFASQLSPDGSALVYSADLGATALTMIMLLKQTPRAMPTWLV